MAHVELSRAAIQDIDRLILTHSLPADTRTRLQRSLRPLERFPTMGPELAGRWAGFRCILGPWRWMLIVYMVFNEGQRVVVVTVQDGRSSAMPAR